MLNDLIVMSEENSLLAFDSSGYMTHEQNIVDVVVNNSKEISWVVCDINYMNKYKRLSNLIVNRGVLKGIQSRLIDINKTIDKSLKMSVLEK
jgi:hypothetical protein